MADVWKESGAARVNAQGDADVRRQVRILQSFGEASSCSEGFRGCYG